MIIDIAETITRWSDDFRAWVIENSGPGVMVLFIIVGLVVFFVAYGALHKNN